MTIFYVLVAWLVTALLSVVPLLLAAWQARALWPVVEMRLLMAALLGQALFQSVGAWFAFATLPIATLDRPAPLWIVCFTASEIAAVVPLVALALRMLRWPDGRNT